MAKFCLKCGEEVQETTKFCAACGHATDQPPPAQPTQYAPPAPQPAQHAQTAQQPQHSQQYPPQQEHAPQPQNQQPQQSYAPQQQYVPPYPTQLQQQYSQPNAQPQQFASQAQPYAPQPQQFAPPNDMPPIPNPGYQTPNSQYAPPPPPAPNSQPSALNAPLDRRAAHKKTPFIIAGAGVVVVALVVVLIVTNVFGLVGKKDGDSGDDNSVTASADGSNGTNASSPGSDGAATNSGDRDITSLNIPEDASDEELLAYSYIEAAIEFYEAGMDSDEAGLPHCARSMYSVASSSICSMRYAVDCLLEMKGTSPAEDDRLRDWDAIASLGWMSPFPYFFEGVVLEARGDSAGAAECYRKAALNPIFLEGMENYKTIKDIDEKALNGLKTVLEEQEDKIFEATNGPRGVFIPRDENCFDVDFLREKAAACLEAEDEDLPGAYGYYLAALQINPFDGDSYADAALVALFIDDGGMFVAYLDEGLLVDPGNARLAFLQDTMKEATGR